MKVGVVEKQRQVQTVDDDMDKDKPNYCTYFLGVAVAQPVRVVRSACMSCSRYPSSSSWLALRFLGLLFLASCSLFFPPSPLPLLPACLYFLELLALSVALLVAFR